MNFFFYYFSPVTNKKFVLSQYIGGIERNGTDYIVKAEASIMAYGIKYNPVLNTAEGRLVSILYWLFSKYQHTNSPDWSPYIFLKVSWENYFVKRSKYFPLVIILLILLTFSVDNVFV